MKNLQEATERICELKGSQVALDALVPALIDALPPTLRARLRDSFDSHAEVARTVMLHADISELVLSTFERDVARIAARLRAAPAESASAPPAGPAETLLLTTTQITTYVGYQVLTSASGFFFRRDGRLFLVSNRHVFSEEASGHQPDRLEVLLHTDARDLSRCTVLSLPLYRNRLSQWRDATDSGGPVDVAVIEIETGLLPANAVLQAFDRSHLDPLDEDIAIGDALTIVGYPLGFHDTVHHLAVARNASVASAYGIRFQRQGCFLTDARTHRGSSGAPVLRRRRLSGPGDAGLPWQLVGVHSTRMDMSSRDRLQDETLGLNLAWYADVLNTLTAA
ncbi:trypsin-like peptidase domain-containing protein [Ideonella sp. 4Y16]|uniref:Trypsin-like peptidase domain-containing protein n=1 Tax=Ideonella alba TaxID=2824118 RepID=A0A941BCD2_9BURK|nr:trypsin-like peptidase domain-containing protein [Ideonella alba]MBQ0931815.1 trypsin-like peptidase domain-containing protein [Ideonella alba]MBQ0941742.1 trypsin-like peptidase domain-containing protein [Ideonella alba]